MLLSLTGLLSTACSTSRPPVAMIEPSYSHLRDVSASAEPAMASDQIPASELTRQLNISEQNPELAPQPISNTTPSEESSADASDSMSSIMLNTSGNPQAAALQAKQLSQTVLEQRQIVSDFYASDYLFEMARLVPTQP